MKKVILAAFAVLGFAVANAGTYYTVGGDSSSDTSFTSSTAGLNYGGWSSEASATATEAHTVAAGNAYIIQSDDSLRSRSKADASWDTFKGDSLTIAGTFNLKDDDNATRTITVNNLIADGGTISVMKSNTAKLTLDGSMTVPEGKTIKFDLDGGKYSGSSISKYPYLRVASTVTGAGTVVLDLFGEVNGNFNSGLPLVRFDFAGDWSGFTGDVVKGRESSSAINSPAKSSYVLMFTGSFGGRIASLSPKSADPYYVINHAANPKGIRAADFPNALRYRTVFYNVKSTDKNVKLFVYPKDKRPTFDLTYYDTDNAETALAKKASGQATAIAVSDITFVDSGDGLETAVWHYDASTYDEGGDDPGAGEPEELTMLSPADGATVALLTDRQKGWIALEPEDRVKVLVSDSSAPVAYKDVTSADFSNGSPVTFTWSGATGAVTLTVKKGDATVETVTTSAGSATVYNLEPGVTYTWTLTSGNVTTEAFTFTTESNPPRIIKAGTMSLLRDLCGWTGLQGCKIRANQVFRGAPPNVSSSPFESRLDAQGVDFWQNRVGLKTQIDFRNASEVAEAGANGKLTFVDNYCNYNIEYYKAYAPSEVASGAGKNFLDALRTILTSSKRPVYFHCKWGRDRTGTMASVILGVLGVSEDDIIDDYHMSPLYNGNQPREYFNNFVSFLTSIKTTYPADTLAKSVEKYFLAIGITKTEIETFRTEMLDGYETPEEPAEDPTWEPPAGATFYEKLANDTRAVTSSDYATGGDYIYKVSDTEYIHVFKSSSTFTLNQDLANVQLLVVGGGGSGGGRYGGGGGAGGVVYQSGRALSAGSYTITVGAGGASVSAKSSGKNGGNSTFSGAGIETVTAIGGGGGGGYYMAGLSGGSGGGASGQVGTGKDGKTDNVGGAGTAGQGYAGGIASTVGNYPARGGGGGAGEAGGNADVGGRGNQPTNEGYIGGNGGNGLDYGTQMLGYAQYFGGGGGGSTTKDTADAVNYRGLGGLGGGGSGAYLRGETATTPQESALQATAGENGLGGGGGGGCVAWGNRVTETGAAGGKGIVIVRYQLTSDDPTIDPTTIEPANLRPVSTQDSPTELLTEDQQTWIYTFTKEQRYGLMANDTTLSPSSAWNTKDIVLFSNGSPLTLAWEGTAGRSCTVELTRLSDNKRIFSKTVSGYSVTVYNLEIGAGYSWSVTCEGKTASAEFHTSPTAPRLLKTGAMRCMRDLGGWTGLQGCTIRQNEIIRGGPANDPDHVSDASLRYADDQAYDFFFNELGLKTEIDLRTTSEIGGNNGKLDVQGTHGVTYKNLHIYENTLYSLSNPSDDQRSFVEIFKTIFNAAKRPVYFHCARGRDRTGTVAMMCEAILGVSEDDIWRDYQSSVFNPPTRSTGTVWGDMTTRYNGFKNFLEQIKSTYPADTLAESAEKYLLSLGFTKDEIETFRTDMLIGYVTPEEPTEPTDPTDKPVIVDGQFIASLQTFAATHPITTPLASGAQISYQQGDDQYYVFTQSGTLTVSSAVTANLLAVGGGGAGGFNCGGGGAGGGVTEVSDQALAAESYAVTVGQGGAKNEDKSGQGGSGGGSSFATLCTAVGGAGGYGYNHATKGSQGGAAAGGGGAGGAASKSECVGTAGGDGTVSEILGFAQTFGGGGGGGNRGNTSSVSAQGGAGGGGAGATVRGSTTTTNAEEGEDGLGGGGGGGAGNTGAQAGDKKTADGGDGIVIVCIKGSADPGKIAIPTAKENLVYTGEEQIGVEPGTGYTLTGNTGTNAKGYTAVATLDDPETTKWADETTEPKEINWSIVKAVNAWTTEPSLSKTTWSVNQSPATLTVGAAAFGTMMATLNGETFDLAKPVFPTETGEYTLVFTVAGSDDYGNLEKKISFTITETPLYSGYYKVGSDGSGHSSFAKSDNSTSGWSLTQDGTIDANHTVSADGDYIVPSGAQLRTLSDDAAENTFLGRSLTLAGGELMLKCKSGSVGTTIQYRKTVNIADLTLTGGGKISHSNDSTEMTLAGGTITIPSGEMGAFSLNGGNIRNFIVKSAICGAGTLQLTWQGSGSAPSQQNDNMKLMGDNSLFTGTLTAVGDTSVASTKYTLVLDGKFGGTITSLPKAKTNSIKVNYGNNPGLTVATATIPEALKKDLLFYSSTVNFSATPSIALITFPAGTTVNPADFTIKYATSESAPTTTTFADLGTIENADDTITLVANFGKPPTGSTFYQKLDNDPRKIASSDFATGGDYIYQVNNKEYIHVFKNGGTFTPNKDLTDVQVLVVGGGGSGGYGSGGGGGAGGLAYRTDVSLSAGTGYAVSVGAGGAKKTSSGSGNNGGISSIGDITAAGGGGGAGKNSAGVAGGSGGGGSGDGKSGGAGTTDLGSAGGAGGVASGHPIGGGGGGADQLGWAAGTQGPSQEESIWNGGCGGDGLDIGSLILGYAQYFAGGGGGGTAGGVKRAGAGGLGGGGRGGYDLNNATYQTPGEDGLGGGGGGGAVDWGSTDGKDHNGAAGGKGVVIIRYPIPYDVLNTEITGTIAMPDWKEGETPSEPDLTGLTVTPDMAAPALLVKYYADADCTQALDAKPILAGTYYVRAEIEKTRRYTAAVSAVTEFTIKAGEKTVVPIPTVSSFVYDGTPKTCVEAGDGYTIDSASTVTATDAGDYSVTLKLNDPEASQWSDLTSADKVIPWSIAQAENEWTTEAAIDKTEWMKTLDEPGKLTPPVAKFGTLVATLNGQAWDGALPTEVGSYTAKWTVEETENYTGLEVTISFKVKPDFYTNSWKTEPTISKTSWKSTEEPATITPAEASYGNDTMSVKISVDNGPFVDWDGKVPTTKGAYKIQWVVEETESYSRLEKTIEFLIDRRYCPTHPFMYQKAGDTTWKGADTFSVALSGISVSSGYATGTIELCQDITDTTTDKMGTLNYKYITLCSNSDDDQIYVWTRLGKSYNGFQVQNGSKLTLTNIVLNLTANGSDKIIVLFEVGAANPNGGEVALGAGAVIQGEVSSSLYSSNTGSSFTLNGGTIRNLTAGGNLLPMPQKSFSVKSGTIENCTVNGAVIPLGDKTVNLSNVTITNNTTTAGAITVGESGVLKVSGDVIVKDNKVGDDEKNIVLQNAANLQMTGALGATASVGVSFGAKGDAFGAFKMTEATKEDKRSAAKFFNDADSTRKLVGHVNDKGKLVWWNSPGMLILFNFN